MPNIPVFNINGTDYKVKDTEAREQISDLKSAISIKYSDLTHLGGTIKNYNSSDNSSYLYPMYQRTTGGIKAHMEGWTGYLWLRSPLFRVYAGQHITAPSNTTGFHLLYFTEKDAGSYAVHKIISAGNTEIVAGNYSYACIAMTMRPSEKPSDDYVYAVVSGGTKYLENDFFYKEPLTTDYNDITEDKRYTSNGLMAYASNDVWRGIAYPYTGNILYTDSPASNHYIPIAIAANGKNPQFACFIGLMCNKGTNTGTIYIMWGTSFYGFVVDDITFDHAFEGNMNGISCDIKNNILTVKYIYEGAIETNTATVNPYYQMLYDHMEHKTGCTVQTGTAPNIAYYGKGFVDYDEYYRFVKDLTDDSQITDHSARITALEESGGGGGGTPSELDWGKGYDLLEFGQEYLYAWLNALKSGTAFKVLFTGDSTTAYYNGTENGLKEIFQTCMAKAGYSNGTYVNKAVSGINATTWVNTYLTADIAEAPTLYVIRHGFNNDAGETETEMAASFRTQMTTALERIRSSLSVRQCSIILMMPNTSDDDPNHRGQSMKKLLDPIVRQLARTYGCGFIDTFRTWYDPGQYADPMYDDPFRDGRSIHPNGLMNRVIVSKLFDFAVPLAYRNYATGQ